MTSTATDDSGTEYGGLHDARAAERIGPYVRGVWSRREYSWYVAASELRSRQITSLLGNLWHLINPLLQVGVFFVIFGLVLEVNRGVENFVGYLAVGIFTYSFTQKSVTMGGRSLVKYRGLIQMVSFPRAILPITTTITEMLAILPAYLVMLIVAIATGEPPALSWVLLIPVFVVHTIMNSGLALVAARAISRVPDIQQVLPFVFRLGFYGSGVLFNVNAYVEGNNRLLFELNPMYCLIEVNRGIVLTDHDVDWSLFGNALIWMVAAVAFGVVYFRRGEDSYGGF